MKNLSNYRSYFFLGLLVVGIFAQSCCKCDDPTDPDCPNYDPCFGVEAPIASFGAGYIYEIPGDEIFNNFYPDSIIYLDGDTIPGTCTFYSYTVDADSFFWRVGQDPRVFKGKQFYLEFGKEFHMQSIDVELQVLKKSSCFEGGFVRDTMRKTLVITSSFLESPSIPFWNNKYHGVSTEFPQDSFTIEFMELIEDERIVNFPRGTFGRTALYRRDFDEVHFTGQNNKTIWLGNAKFQPEDRKKVVIRYKVSHDLGETQNWHTYIGYRVE